MREVTKPWCDRERILDPGVEGAFTNSFRLMNDPGVDDGLAGMGDYI